jgi:hypothetical protein
LADFLAIVLIRFNALGKRLVVSIHRNFAAAPGNYAVDSLKPYTPSQ